MKGLKVIELKKLAPKFPIPDFEDGCAKCGRGFFEDCDDDPTQGYNDLIIRDDYEVDAEPEPEAFGGWRNVYFHKECY